MTDTLQHYLNGKRVDGTSGRTGDVYIYRPIS